MACPCVTTSAPSLPRHERGLITLGPAATVRPRATRRRRGRACSKTPRTDARPRARTSSRSVGSCTASGTPSANTVAGTCGRHRTTCRWQCARHRCRGRAPLVRDHRLAQRGGVDGGPREGEVGPVSPARSVDRACTSAPVSRTQSNWSSLVTRQQWGAGGNPWTRQRLFRPHFDAHSRSARRVSLDSRARVPVASRGDIVRTPQRLRRSSPRLP